MLPCPFCGSKIDITNPDVLYVSSVGWKYDKKLDCKTYHHYSEIPKEQWCYQLVCICGLELHGDSKEEVIKLWNTRVKN